MFVRRMAVAATAVAIAAALVSVPVVQPAAALVPSATAAGVFQPVPPARILDTRVGLGAPKRSLATRAVVPVPVAGRGGVPAGASTVLLSVTAISPTAAGYLTGYAGGTARPGVSNLDFAARQSIANLMLVPVGSDGTVDLYNGSAGTVELIADVSGYFLPGTPTVAGGLQPVGPARVLDTRTGVGAVKQPVAARGTVRLPVAGHGAVPAGVTAVLLTVTAINPSAAGYLTAYAGGTAQPGVSNLDFPARQSIANLILAPVGSDGTVDLYNGSAGSVALVADVSGYFFPGTATVTGALAQLLPSRILDTRIGTGAAARPVAGRGTVTLQVAGRGGLPASGVSAVLLNVTAVSPTAAGYLTGYAGGTARPGVSGLDFAARQSMANLMLVPVGSDGTVDLYNGSAGTVELIADVSGYLRGTTVSWHDYQKVDPPRGRPSSVSCVGESFCMLVDRTGHAAEYDGTSWTPSGLIDPDAEPTSVSCVSAVFCVAVDNRGNGLRFDGSHWTLDSGVLNVSGPDSTISCASVSLCMAVTSNDAISYTPAGWHPFGQVAPPSGGSLSDISCPSEQFCLAVDSAGRALSYDGTGWSSPVDVFDSGVSHVWCSSATRCVAVHLRSAASFDGASWQNPVPIEPGLPVLVGVACAGSQDCVAVDSSGNRLDFDGTSWSAPTPTDPNLQLAAISCTATTLCVAVDNYGGSAVRQAGGWSAQAAIDPNSGYLNAISCPAANYCVAVDGSGATLIYTSAGWSSPVSIDPHYELSMISCASASRCVAAGTVRSEDQFRSVLLVRNGTSWTPDQTVDPNVMVTALSCLAPGFCLAVLDSGHVLGYDGTSWTAQPGSGIGATSLSCATMSFCVASRGGGYWVFNGSSWTTLSAIRTGIQFSPISCPALNYCMTTDSSGYRWVFDGTAWSPNTRVRYPGARAPSTLSCVSRYLCVGAGEVRTWSYVASIFDGQNWTYDDLNNPPPVDVASADATASCGSTAFCKSVIGAYARSWS
ncbi:MAG: hypothetical protein ACR2N4_07345 [Jatrophihabitans sp.]